MINALQSGASALTALERQQELIAGNLANVQTGGFRRAILSFQERGSTDGSAQPGTEIAAEVLDFSQGRLEPTGRKLDLAIEGNGFLVFEGDGVTLYSRGGVLQRTSQGQLINADGFALLGNGGPVTVPPDIAESEIEIGADGSLSARGQTLGQIEIASFSDNSQLEAHGQLYFVAPQGKTPDGTPGQLVQGSRELSNANPVNELVSLIVTSRMFEAVQRSIRTISETVQQNYRN